MRFLLGSLLVVMLATSVSHAEYEADDVGTDDKTSQQVPPEAPLLKPKKEGVSDTPKEERKYFVSDPSRVDAGIFHVAFALGGNFYIEPKVATATRLPTGDYSKDFGFQGGVYFDWDYSELPQDIPLGLRGMVGYKYILSSTHVFTFDGVVRRMIRTSNKSSLGLAIGASAGVWYRQESLDPPLSDEEIRFLPSLILGAGFDFDPFMVDFKWLINRLSGDNSITGFELYFGFRL
jgi:hypothetical protein